MGVLEQALVVSEKLRALETQKVDAAAALKAKGRSHCASMRLFLNGGAEYTTHHAKRSLDPIDAILR